MGGITARDIVAVELENFFDNVEAAMEEFEIEDYQITRELREVDLLAEWESWR